MSDVLPTTRAFDPSRAVMRLDEVTAEPAGEELFITDSDVARRLRAVASELRVVSSRRRAMGLAGELDSLARLLDPSGEAAA